MDNRNLQDNRAAADETAIDATVPLNQLSRAEQWKRIRSNPRLRGQHGGILDEYGFYLLLAALTLVAILVLFSHNSVDTQVQQLTTELNNVMGKVKTNYRGQYSKVSVTSLIDNGVFRDLTTMTDTGGTISVQPGGGTLTVAPARLLSNNDSVQYTVPNQPDAACPAIVAAFQSSAGRIVVNGTTIKDVGGSVDPSKVKCSGDSNTLNLFMS
ncbi:MAG: pilus assembly protein PilS [Cupriavidus sp.]|uniref:type 4 pilus major pilin n=1 Tax=Cupriavidus TaxID=106589 RepID=UPI0002A3A6E7|nr:MULTISPECIES: type 4 pilus major pilin [Cupriavidus]EKZ97089.1 type IV prepilin protein PilS [Cupriavidus sp. HMR-1]MBU66977.1 pilus assembly protein PilS [Cupriavidus sp.]MCA3193885.1 pilus assembly protein PilS [Cupriavidus sp.]MCA3198314.1 pilus assembly protein PilS [Cupriavidus sp.]MCA3233601.1 pilus assembly protein PilS [Cupriavidus sp.]